MSKRRRRVGSDTALTICALDDLLMEIGAKSAGLVATGSRTCISKRFAHPPRSDRSPYNEALSVLKHAPPACLILNVLWLNAFSRQSHVRISTVWDYDAQELGLFSKVHLEKGNVVEGPKFLLLEVDAEQEGLNSQMQFQERSKTWVGCGPARLVNHSCSPNARWVSQSIKGRQTPGCRLMALTVLRPVAPGEQLYASYGEHYFGKGYERCKCPHHPRRHVIDLTDDDDDDTPPRMIIDMTDDVDEPPPLIIDFTSHDSDSDDFEIDNLPHTPKKRVPLDVDDYLAGTAKRSLGWASPQRW